MGGRVEKELIESEVTEEGLGWGNVIGCSLSSLQSPLLFLIPAVSSIAPSPTRESVHRLGKTHPLPFSLHSSPTCHLWPPSTRITFIELYHKFASFENKKFLKETAYIPYRILSNIITVSNYRLSFYCHQDTDGSLPANETGDRISTVLFYVSTETALMCKKSVMTVYGEFDYSSIVALNFLKEFF